jgi:hypothetical protein
MDLIGDITICTVVYITCESAHSHDDLQLGDLRNMGYSFQSLTSTTDMIIMHAHVFVDRGVDIEVYITCKDKQFTLGPSIPQGTPASCILYAMPYILYRIRYIPSPLSCILYPV